MRQNEKQIVNPLLTYVYKAIYGETLWKQWNTRRICGYIGQRSSANPRDPLEISRVRVEKFLFCGLWINFRGAGADQIKSEQKIK